MKIRKQTYTLSQYLKLMQREVIRTDQECQRMSGQWNNNMVNELVYTVLTDGYMPPIILGEETTNGIERKWIIDGLQRSTTLMLFRYGNTKITKNIDECMVTYQRKVLDKDGNPERDAQGEILWETVQYDIRNKTYGQLPEELQDRYNEYQLESVIHQECGTAEISKLVRKYNNHQSMNAAQKAFTYMDNFAADVRKITQNRFFQDVYSSTQKGKINGSFERIVCDITLLCNYPDKYRKDAKQGFKWLNENASLYDFETINDLLTRLAGSLEVTEETKELFNVRNSAIFVAVFKAFTELNGMDAGFGDFLKWLMDFGHGITIDGKTWDDLNVAKASRDTTVVHGKIDHLTELVKRYIAENRKAA